jgi:hypothetical protein
LNKKDGIDMLTLKINWRISNSGPLLSKQKITLPTKPSLLSCCGKSHNHSFINPRAAFAVQNSNSYIRKR